jgi:hypothetical protein
MGSKNLEKALSWILAGDNGQAFRNDFNVVLEAVKGLSAEDKKILKRVHEKGFAQVEKLMNMEVSGQRSYGWDQQR